MALFSTITCLALCGELKRISPASIEAAEEKATQGPLRDDHVWTVTVMPRVQGGAELHGDAWHEDAVPRRSVRRQASKGPGTGVVGASGPTLGWKETASGRQEVPVGPQGKERGFGDFLLTVGPHSVAPQ